MSKEQSPIDDFVIHGIKTVGDYDYYLLVDNDGGCFIQRIDSDDESTRFCKMATPAEGTSLSAKAVLIDTFWTSPASEDKNYTYIFQCSRK